MSRTAREPAPPRRVVLVGGESTGKTTLAAALAAELAAPWVPEYARQYAAAAGRPLTAADVEPIARGQLALEDDAACRAGPLLILDTDLVSTVAYAHHYYGACPLWIEAAARARGGLYLLLHPDVPWVADPQRDQPRARAALRARFEAAVAALELPLVVHVAGSWPERARTARAAIARFLASRTPP